MVTTRRRTSTTAVRRRKTTKTPTMHAIARALGFPGLLRTVRTVRTRAQVAAAAARRRRRKTATPRRSAWL